MGLGDLLSRGTAELSRIFFGAAPSVPASESAKGLASELASNASIRSQLAQTPHLGVLEKLSRRPLSRWEYVLRHHKILLDLKLRFQGLGLSTAIPDGFMTESKRRVTGLEVLQGWAVLSSYGHLFGTFSTERALLFHLAHDKRLPELAETVEERFRRASREQIARRSMYSFVRVLTSAQLSRDDQGIPPVLLAAARDLWALYEYSDNFPLFKKLRKIFVLSRRLAYLPMHAEAGLSGLMVSASSGDVSDLLDHGAVVFDAFSDVDTPLSRVLKALDTYDYEEVFTGPTASTLVLTHLREFKRWWRAHDAENTPLAARLSLLRSRPPDWPTIDAAEDLSRVCRIEFQARERTWLVEVSQWWASGAPWMDGSNFLISSLPDGVRMYVDLFSSNGESEPGPACNRHVAMLLASKCERSWENPDHNANRILWRSLAKYGVALLNYLLPEGLRARVSAVRATGGSLGLAVAAQSLHDAVARVRLFCSRLRAEEESRGTELTALGELLAGIAAGSEPVLIFLGRVLIEDEVTGLTAHELDGVAAFFFEDRIDWVLVEVKEGKGGTTKQLVELQKRLRAPGVLSEQHSLSSARARYLRVSWPARA